MLAEPMTLYKLMNLYMLKQVNFPLTNAQLSSFFLDRDYTATYASAGLKRPAGRGTHPPGDGSQQHPLRDYPGGGGYAGFLWKNHFPRYCGGHERVPEGEQIPDAGRGRFYL